jgi:hypothetical protein
VDIQEHDVMELDATHFLIRRRHFFSIARFRGTHPPNPHIYMHAITQYARSQHKHTQQKNAREIHSDWK